MTTAEIVAAIKIIALKRNKKFAPIKEIPILDGFLAGNLMKTDITKLKKILGKYINFVLPLHIETENYDLMRASRAYCSDIMCVRISSIAYIRNNYTISKKDEPAVKAWESNINTVVNELVEKIKDLEKSMVTNAQRKKQLQIRGLVEPKILAGLDLIAEDWKIILYEQHIKFLESLVARFIELYPSNNVHPDSIDRKSKSYFMSMQAKGVIKWAGKDISAYYTTTTVEEREKTAKRVAEDGAMSFVHKMCVKLGGIKFGDDVLLTKTYGQSTPFESDTEVISSRFKFTMHNSIITNYSVLGNGYYQFPCVFERVTIGDTTFTRLSEYELKTKINAIK